MIIPMPVSMNSSKIPTHRANTVPTTTPHAAVPNMNEPPRIAINKCQQRIAINNINNANVTTRNIINFS